MLIKFLFALKSIDVTSLSYFDGDTGHSGLPLMHCSAGQNSVDCVGQFSKL